MGGSIVDAVALSRRFGVHEVFRDLTLRLQPGDIHALIGPNGSGKTTLLRILAGIMDPSSGSVQVLGGSPTDPSIRRRIGWVPASERSFYLRISGLENLVFFARLYGMSLRFANERAREMLVRVGLEDAQNQAAFAYSQGMLKRLAVARAFLADPELLLLDEATHDLDPRGEEATLDLVRESALRGATVVWATQLIDEIPGFAGTVTVLSGGGAVFQGAVSELLERGTVRRYTLSVTFNGEGTSGIEAAGRRLGALGTLQTESATPGRLRLLLEPETSIGAALAALADGGLEVVGCTQETSEIRQAFLTVTEQGSL